MQTFSPVSYFVQESRKYVTCLSRWDETVVGSLLPYECPCLVLRWRAVRRDGEGGIGTTLELLLVCSRLIIEKAVKLPKISAASPPTNPN
jgi:hypothetical protein